MLVALIFDQCMMKSVCDVAAYVGSTDLRSVYDEISGDVAAYVGSTDLRSVYDEISGDVAAYVGSTDVRSIPKNADNPYTCQEGDIAHGYSKGKAVPLQARCAQRVPGS